MENSLTKTAIAAAAFESFKSIIHKSADENVDRCSLNLFPDDIVLQILKKIVDLKTLCRCKLVTKRVSSLVHLVDTISFTTPLVNPNLITDFNTIQCQVFTPEIRYPLQNQDS